MTGEEIANIVGMLIERMSALTFVDFNRDQALKQGLSVHMHAVVNRIKYGFPITNPLLSEIKRMYPYLFSMVMLSLEDLKTTYHIDIPEDEAAYLLLHFQASIERYEYNRSNKKRVVIVCHMGIGMSNLLAVKIEQSFLDIDILAAIGKGDLPRFLRDHSIDFIISTISLDKVDVPYVVVSPLLESKDKKKLTRFIQELEKKPFQEKSAIQHGKVLREELIFNKVNKEHRYEVIEMLGNVLFQKGFVADSFTHNAINRERKSSTSIGGGVAIPHASPLLITQSAVAMAILEEPIEWGTELVSVVFMLALSNDVQGLTRSVIREIAAISENPATVQQLIEATETEQIMNILSK